MLTTNSEDRENNVPLQICALAEEIKVCLLKRITPGRLTFVSEAAGLYRNIFSPADTFFCDTIVGIDTDNVCDIHNPIAAVQYGISFGDKQ